MARKYFGTDGVRGLVGEGPITPEFVMRLGYAAGKVLVKGGAGQGGRSTVLIGKDTRISGYMLEAALEAGFSAAGVDVMLAGPMPTPAIAYLTRALRLQAGVVISASHNPFQDNGIKFFSGHGTKLPDAVELEIEDAIDQPMGCEPSEKLGRASRLLDAQGRYTKPDGFNINAGVGATAPKAMAQAVVEHKADLGIALDGDADRLIMCDASGRLYNGDELLYVMVRARMATGKVEGAVGTLMTNMALEVAFKEMGIGFARAKVGDRYVLEMMREKGWLFGGEGSGHLLALDRHTTGDGIVSALQVLEALRRSKTSLAECCSDLTLYPQTLVNVRVQPGFDWTRNSAVVAEKEAVESELGNNGRVLIRASGTEPLVRVMVEAKEAELAERMARRIAALVEA
ncbi:MAG: phosphoglucosamine mutase [Oxalobacteraceae bacterium]|nr:MAG: phosphoglucosamine mutase [Oxalobacteraceae bacterium]